MLKLIKVIIFLLFSNLVANPVLAAFPKSSVGSKKMDESVYLIIAEPKEKPKDVPPKESATNGKLDIPKKIFKARHTAPKTAVSSTHTVTRKGAATSARIPKSPTASATNKAVEPHD